MKELSEILEDDEMRALFEQYLSGRFCDENIKFYNAVHQYKQLASADLRSARGKTIRDKFLAAGADHEINIDSQERSVAVENATSGEKDVFDAVQCKCYRLMEVDALKFKSSPLYVQHQEGKTRLRRSPVMDSIKADLLLNKYFAEFMEGHKQRALIIFAQEMERYKKITDPKKKEERRSSLTTKFFAEKSTFYIKADTDQVKKSIKTFCDSPSEDNLVDVNGLIQDRIDSMHNKFCQSKYWKAYEAEKARYEWTQSTRIRSLNDLLSRNEVLSLFMNYCTSKEKDRDLQFIIDLDTYRAEPDLDIRSTLLDDIRRSYFENGDESQHAVSEEAIEHGYTSTKRELVFTFEEFMKSAEFQAWKESKRPKGLEQQEAQLEVDESSKKIGVTGIISFILKDKPEQASQIEECEVFSSKDWDRIALGVADITYKKDEPICQEGDPVLAISYIKSGSCRIEKVIDGRNVVLASNFGEGKFFGELSFLKKSQKLASASVIASSEEAIVVKVHTDRLTSNLNADIDLARRFFLMLCIALAERLIGSSQSSQKGSQKVCFPAAKIKRISVADTMEAKEAQVLKRLKSHISNNERLLFDFNCRYMEKKARGNLLLLTSLITFRSKTFGKKVEIFIPAAQITTVRQTSDKTVMLFVRGANKPQELTFKFDEPSMTQKAASFLQNYKAVKRQDTPRKALSKLGMEPAVKAPSSDLALTSEEWETLFKSCDMVFHKTNDVILKQNVRSNKIYQIVSGSCTVIVDGAPVGEMKSGEVFGEIGFLLGIPATADVVVSTPKAVVASFEVDDVMDCLVDNPHLGPGFFRYIAATLAKRLASKGR